MTIEYKKQILDKEGKPLKIGMIAKHHCIRCIRKMRGLQHIGYEVYGMGDKLAYGAEEYKTYSVWKNEKQFKNSIKILIKEGCSILDWNNEPDRPAVWIREVINEMGVQDKVKLVVDCHDLDSIRLLQEVIPIPERNMINAADGITYVSKPIQDITNKLHRVPVPTIVLYNYPTLSMIENTKIDWENISERKGLVYEGGVNEIGNDLMSQMFPYRELFPIFKQLISQGNEVHAYVGNSTAYTTGQNTGVVLHQPTQFDKLLNEITKFKYNLVIFNYDKNTGKQYKQTELTTANKIWDGLCAGLPSLVCHCKTMEEYVEKHKIGITFNNVSEIGNCTQLEDKYKELVENVKKKRKELVMEKQIWRLENFYATLLGVEIKSIPKNIQNLSIFEYGKEDTKILLSKKK